MNLSAEFFEQINFGKKRFVIIDEIDLTFLEPEYFVKAKNSQLKLILANGNYIDVEEYFKLTK